MLCFGGVHVSSILRVYYDFHYVRVNETKLKCQVGMWMCAYIYLTMCACICVCVHVHICVHVCLCTCVCVRIMFIFVCECRDYGWGIYSLIYPLMYVVHLWCWLCLNTV